MVAFARSPLTNPSHSRRTPGSPSLLDQLADGTLAQAIIAMAEDLATLGAAIDLAIAEDEIDRIDDAAIEALIADLGLAPAPDRRAGGTNP